MSNSLVTPLVCAGFMGPASAFLLLCFWSYTEPLPQTTSGPCVTHKWSWGTGGAPSMGKLCRMPQGNWSSNKTF